MKLNKVIAIPAITLAAGISLAACGSARPAAKAAANSAPVASSTPSYTDLANCNTLNTDITAYLHSSSSADLDTLNTDLTQVSSSRTESPALTAATTAFGHDITATINGTAPSSTTADAKAVETACAAAGVTIAIPKTPAAGTKIFTYTGHGKESTPKFTTTGDFTVTWSFTGNADVTQWATNTTTSPDNFSISMFSTGTTDVGQTGQDLNFNDPNEIEASDSGNQTITGDDGTHYFTVDSGASCSWTFTVVAAS